MTEKAVGFLENGEIDFSNKHSNEKKGKWNPNLDIKIIDGITYIVNKINPVTETFRIRPNGRYTQVVLEREGRTSHRQEIRRQVAIGETLKQIGMQFSDGKIEENDLYFYGDDDHKYILKDYKKFKKNFDLKKLIQKCEWNHRIEKITSFVKKATFKILPTTKAAALLLSGAFTLESFSTPTMDEPVTQSFSVPGSNGSIREEKMVTIPQEYQELQNLIEAQEKFFETEFQFEQRLQETVTMSGTEQSASLGSRLNLDKMHEVMQSKMGVCFEKYGAMYGVDPYLIAAFCGGESSFRYQEVIPGGKFYNGSAVGPMQLENPSGQEMVTYNVLTGEYDVVPMTMENAMDLEKNIQLGTMRIANILKTFSGNIRLAIQSYNIGASNGNIVARLYANQIGSTPEAVKNNVEDTGWKQVFLDIHNHPQNYYWPNWKGTFGTLNYDDYILSHYVGRYSKNIINGETVVIDMVTGHKMLPNDLLALYQTDLQHRTR